MKTIYRKIVSAAADGKIKFAPKRPRIIANVNKQVDVFRSKFFPNVFEPNSVPKRNPNISTVNHSGKNHIQERFIFDSIG